MDHRAASWKHARLGQAAATQQQVSSWPPAEASPAVPSRGPRRNRGGGYAVDTRCPSGIGAVRHRRGTARPRRRPAAAAGSSGSPPRPADVERTACDQARSAASGARGTAGRPSRGARRARSPRPAGWRRSSCSGGAPRNSNPAAPTPAGATRATSASNRPSPTRAMPPAPRPPSVSSRRSSAPRWAAVAFPGYRAVPAASCPPVFRRRGFGGGGGGRNAIIGAAVAAVAVPAILSIIEQARANDRSAPASEPPGLPPAEERRFVAGEVLFIMAPMHRRPPSARSSGASSCVCSSGRQRKSSAP